MSADAEHDSGPAPAAGRRRRTVLLSLLAAAALLALLAWWVTRPQQVAGIVLDRLGRALDLEITASGVSEYRLGDMPRLVVRDVVARQPGADAPLLRADRLSLSLPWSTILSPDAGIVVERLEADTPVIELAALQRWQESRPPGPPMRIPSVTDGVRIEDGRVLGGDWSVEALTLDVPALHPGRAVRGRLQGRFHNGDLRIPFDLHVALTRPAAGAGAGAFGHVAIATPDWRMPMQVLLSGRLHEGSDAIGLDGFRVGALAEFDGGDDAQPLPFVFGLAGPLRYRDGRFDVEPLGTVVRGRGIVPTLEARGMLAWQQQLDLHLRGHLAGWPEGWPELPAPLDAADAPVPFELGYTGPSDLSGRTRLELQRGATRFEAAFRLPEVLDWLDQLATGNPLPPLDGRLSTPRLELAGATLEGIELQVDGSESGDE